ncbi:hypothetical protein HF324_09070 [Chitinophaga oryzae]|uniref:Uncharacterized protein n=1 Tax=Chitinophaga oryzae TaxID=2725414 RepID=A0AAE6ZF43_9BACT|nr:hypothetical protein [Chitinophaga oryzae]QJB31511.1 hypothetical protein HF329_09415 [Chitinophaga oryzae]QJB37993.1 hypothetical protein HF324_09070 [Chitinophaga oryzae]
MKRILLFIALVAAGITATRFTSGAQSDKHNPKGNAVTRTYTYYPGYWRGNAIHPDDAAFMYPYSYQLDYASGIATRMTGPAYYMLSASDYCRDIWLQSNVNPSCTTGCRTWSYYYSATSVFTSAVNYRIFACPL